MDYSDAVGKSYKQNACGDKRKFGSLDKALRQVKKLNSPFVKAYLCRSCNRWHVGHEPGTMRYS